MTDLRDAVHDGGEGINYTPVFLAQQRDPLELLIKDGVNVRAESDQRIRLVRGTGPEEVHHFVVEVLDDDGGVAESTRSVHDDFPLAANDYNRRIVSPCQTVADMPICHGSLGVT